MIVAQCRLRFISRVAAIRSRRAREHPQTTAIESEDTLKAAERRHELAGITKAVFGSA
jgi:hypothetical protein